jgi:hypothetical protein
MSIMHREEQVEADEERARGAVGVRNVREVEYPGRPAVIVRTTRLVGPDLGLEESPPSSSRPGDAPD